MNPFGQNTRAMAADLVRIAKIGQRTHSAKTSKDLRVFDDEFFYNNLQFKLLIDVDIAKVIKGMLIKDHIYTATIQKLLVQSILDAMVILLN